MKFDGILLCTDLDGTLLNSDRTVSRENIEAITYFQQNGGYFTFVSGRLPYFMNAACEAICPNAPIGCGNGGAVYDLAARRYLYTQPLSPVAFELVDAVLAELPHVGVQTYTFDTLYFYNNNVAMEWFRRVTGMPNRVCHYREVVGAVAKILFCEDNEADMERLQSILQNHPLAAQFTLVRSEKTLFEILPAGISKGSALTEIARRLHVDVQRTIAVGDYLNDVPMLEQAGVGVAVANALPGVKAVADVVTVSNDEHAIARVIEQLENGTLLGVLS